MRSPFTLHNDTKGIINLIQRRRCAIDIVVQSYAKILATIMMTKVTGYALESQVTSDPLHLPFLVAPL